MFKCWVWKARSNLSEIVMFQQVSEIATSQVQAIQTQQDSRDKELTSLRQQLVDFQAQSNEKTVIG